MRTATTSRRWRFPWTGPRSCPDPLTGRSKFGIRVRRSPQNRPSLATKLMSVGLPGSQAGARVREDERPRQLGHHDGGDFPGRDQDRVWIVRQDDQSLGFWCAGALESPLLGHYRRLLACLADKLELLSEKTDTHSDNISSVAFSSDGTKIVSGSSDKTIKVWDSGALEPSKSPPLLAQTDACWLVWQATWSC